MDVSRPQRVLNSNFPFGRLDTKSWGDTVPRDYVRAENGQDDPGHCCLWVECAQHARPRPGWHKFTRTLFWFCKQEYHPRLVRAGDCGVLSFRPRPTTRNQPATGVQARFPAGVWSLPSLGSRLSPGTHCSQEAPGSEAHSSQRKKKNLNTRRMLENDG